MISKCPECNTSGKIDNKLAGTEVRCPRCGGNFVAQDSQLIMWYYAEGENKKGPFEQKDFDRLVAEGTVGPATQVWSKGMVDWQPLSSVMQSPAKKWYYAEGNNKIGPIDQEQFDRLVADGAIATDSLVWSKGMSKWQTLTEVITSTPIPEKCGNCSKDFTPSLLTDRSGLKVCEKCRFKLLQAERKKLLKYGNLLSRFIAKTIDLLFMLAMAAMVEGLSRKLFPASYAENTITLVFTITLTINMLLGIFYVTWFVGKFGATPGKMVLDLKITNPIGGKIGYLHAFARYCGEYIVAFGLVGVLILAIFWALSKTLPTIPLLGSIGLAVLITVSLVYAPALFDSERRTLYDRLCNTRVVDA